MAEDKEFYPLSKFELAFIAPIIHGELVKLIEFREEKGANAVLDFGIEILNGIMAKMPDHRKK